MYEGHITFVPGITVGHMQNDEAMTGVTAICFGSEGAAAGVAVRGASPGTRELALLDPVNRVQRVHAIALCGGSAFGLGAADGVMRYLEEKGIGFDTGVARVPIVPAAVIFDLAYGSANVRPDAEMGYHAAACAGADLRQGNVGAGRGATVGKGILGGIPAKGGVGAASVELPGGIIVGALVVVNAVGDVYDPDTNRLLACASVNGKPAPFSQTPLMARKEPMPGTNTTIGVIATNALLDKAAANRLASVAHDGLALSIRPAHTCYDGDTLFAASTGNLSCEQMLLETVAVQVITQAVCNAVEAASEGAS